MQTPGKREGESSKEISRDCRTFKFPATLEETFLDGCLESVITCHHVQNQPRRRRKRNTHGFLLKCQPLRVSRKPGGNNRQERKDAVSGRKDGNRGAGNTLARQQVRTGKRSFAIGGRPQCVVEQRKSCISYRMANVATLPTANAGVTRTRWHRQHAVVVATKKVHPEGKNGKGRE